MAKEVLHTLLGALTASSNSAAQTFRACRRLVEYLHTEPQDVHQVDLKGLFSAMRSARRFKPMAMLAECAIGLGCDHGYVRRQYGQALIDLGLPSAAIDVLRPLAEANGAEEQEERFEAKGLIGRAYKDLYVNGQLGKTPIGKSVLQKAVDSYGEAYQAQKLIWHGINVVALLHRAKIDGLSVCFDRTSKQVASEVLDSLANKERRGESLEAWDWATAAEAHIAHENWDEAEHAIKNYVEANDRHPFKLAGTLRQLEQVWNIGSLNEKGHEIVSVLKGELVSLGNGQLSYSSSDLTQAGGVNKEAYQRILGHEGAKAHAWIQHMLKCGRSVGQVRRKFDAGGTGTCFVVDGERFNERWRGQRLLLTNEHVVTADASLNTDGRTLVKEVAAIAFQIYEAENKSKLPSDYGGIAIKEVLWCSKRQAHDATLLLPETMPDDMLGLSFGRTLPPLLDDKPQCIYVIGHPGGRGLAYSIQENQLIDYENLSAADAGQPRRVHYTSPTEGGSSGSPAFNSDWNVIALHHAGGEYVSRLNGESGTYPANEGIWIESICAATRASAKDGEIWQS